MTPQSSDRGAPTTEAPQLSIDRALCTGHGRCYDLGPTWFAPDANGLGTVTAARVDPADVERVRRIVNSCPERAISLLDVQ